ncbi:MAG: mechanosensitive ion channel family protein [Bacteroidales bacterium]|nr:mechanosensitive ion channel family protein [Bacteroidales bacterium]
MKDIYIWNNTLLDILISLGIIIAGFFLAKVIYLIFTKVFGRLAAKTESTLDDLLVDKFRAPFMFAAVIASIWYAIKRLNTTPEVQDSIGKIYTILIVINFTWAFSRLFSGILQNVFNNLSKRDGSRLNDSTVEILQQASKYLIWSLGILVAMHNVGIEIGTLIAGLGIGGVAVALAAQDTLKNLLGGFMLFFDHPFNIGERIRFAGIDGFVLTIGLRSLRVRTLDGRIVTIPNSQVVDNAIENVNSEPSTKIKVTLGLTYDTTPEKMELAMKLLKDIPSKIPEIEETTGATFMEYGDFSLQILFVYYIKKTGDYFQTQSDVNMEILRRFNENGLEFAFPTQTIYTKSEA